VDDDADIFLSVAETAERLGLTARALRLYERKGLVKPQRTAAGWRVYGRVELQRLHQVVALKAMGLTLERIKALLEGGVDLAGVLALQEEALAAEAAQIARALALVRAARMRLRNGLPLGTDDMISLTKEAAMADQKPTPEMRRLLAKHLSVEQIGTLALRYGLTNDPEVAAAQERWRELMARAEALAGGDPRSPDALALAKDWSEHYRSVTARDPELIVAMKEVYSEGYSGPTPGQGMPMSNPAWDFIRAALTSATPEMRVFAKHLSPEQLARLRRRQRPTDPEGEAERVRELMARAEALAGSDPGAPEAQALAREWRDRTLKTLGDDPELMLALKKAWDKEYALPAVAQDLPMSKAAWDFLQAALAKLPGEEARLTKFLGVSPRLPVADLDRAIAFYKDTLGFQLKNSFPKNKPTFAIIARGEAWLQLYVPERARTEPYGEGVSLSFNVVDARPVYEAVKDRVTIDWGPEVYSYGRREFSFKDPDGYGIIISAETSDPPDCEES
jgi:DNA-binding transcriptional MerR regulator/catechol 2,3-dioxygenase-like lactoylglutathione lyase family enzyme